MKYTMGLPATEEQIYCELNRLSDNELTTIVNNWESKSKMVKLLRHIWLDYVLDNSDLQRFNYENAREILTNRTSKRLATNS